MKKKIAFITGCSSGLGFFTARKLINSGYIVYATMRSLTNKESLKAACGESENLHILELDLIDDEKIISTAKEVLHQHGHIDLLIHNAAAALIGPVDSATTAEMQYLYKVNVFSAVNITQQFLPSMRKNNSGHIIFIGSISGIESAAYQGLYASTKFAIEAIASSWATTLHKWNIKVTIIEPGAMNTELPNKALPGSYYSSSSSDPYVDFNINAMNFLKEVLSKGTDPDIVAGLILDVANLQTPVLRYQTCVFSKELVQRHLKDPDGTKWVEEHRQFVEPFYRKL